MPEPVGEKPEAMFLGSCPYRSVSRVQGVDGKDETSELDGGAFAPRPGDLLVYWER